MKRFKKVQKAMVKLEKIKGYQALDTNLHLKKFYFCINNYSMELNEKIINISIQTKTEIKMLNDNEKTFYFELAY